MTATKRQSVSECVCEKEGGLLLFLILPKPPNTDVFIES